MADLEGEWQPGMMGLLTRNVGRRIRLTVDHPGRINGHRARGQQFEGELLTIGPSDVSAVYVALSFRCDDGTVQELNLPLSHPIDVLVAPIQEPAPLTEEGAAALVAEAIRRYELDPLFHARAQVAARLAEHTDFSDLEGAVLVGAVLALVVAEHPEVAGP